MSLLTNGQPATTEQKNKLKQRQQRFIHRTLNNYPGQSLLILRIVLPGQIQKNRVIAQFFKTTQAAFELGLRKIGLRLDQFQVTAWQTNAGCVAFYLSKLDLRELETNARDFLKHYPGAALCQFELITLQASTKLAAPTATTKEAETILGASQS